MDEESARVDEAVAGFLAADGPGCALCVLKEGELAHASGYGLANLEYGIPIETGTLFHAASLSKQFTALAIRILESEGLLSLGDEIGEHVEEMPDLGGGLTIERLLNHTSGLRDQWELLCLAGYRLEDAIDRSDVLGLILRQRELNFAPGSEYRYCSSGYSLLALAIERITGQGFGEFCRGRIFGPLGMSRTRVVEDYSALVPGRAQSYRPDGAGGFVAAPLTLAAPGGTGLQSSVDDLAHWERAFYPNDLFDRGLVEGMLVPGRLGSGETIPYGQGLALSEYKGLGAVRHDGEDAGYRAHMLRLPSERLGVYLLGNLGSLDAAALVEAVADIYLGPRPFERRWPGEGRKAVGLPEAELASRASLYYDSRTAMTRKLELREGRLWLALGKGLELEALSADEFRIVGRPWALYSFGPSPEPGRQRMTERIGSAPPALYDSVQPVNPSPDELREYAGTYLSTELDALYEIVFDGKGLELRRRRQAPRRLSPSFADAFTGEAAQGQGALGLAFERDGSSAVAGFRLTARDARKVRFARLRPGV